MSQEQKDYCFCTLALGKKYRLLTQQLAQDLEKYSPGTYLVIYTDEPQDFSQTHNTLAFKYQQQGILHCYHDRRFVIEKALSKFPVAIHIDADTKILSNVPEITHTSGIVGRQENLLEHVKKYSPERLPYIEKIASKLDIPLENASFVGESLYIVGRDDGKETDFIKYWGMIGSYLELHRIHAGDGNAIGLAAAKVGWTINSESWSGLHQVTKHFDASHTPEPKNWVKNLRRRVGYHYRFNKARLTALQKFDFYYK
ncbi:hypothetical protein H6G06_26220 [Anabaena sphaerica FACHB-251]|uniref:Uncharacterized protein n=1 Tax=Anabaena sphaerica FACHB-251 TaxID=2692883 RepID=A0A926WLT0_9NOST|nr:hypothetical protein [Anabaena sphaerica]MBD2296877.1 hypothetical protein [Anabaena sphaerica FACHB-251]